jgi:nitrogen regulatory protein P-II 1
MKHIEGIIRVHKLDELKDVLAELGVPGMTVSEVRGFSRSKGNLQVYRGSSYVVDFVPKLKIEIVVSDVLAPQIVDVIMSTTRTGQIGDGKVFVSEVDSCVRIRTGERDDDAL